MNKNINKTSILKQQLFLHSKIWLMIAILSIIILSVYNLILSWILQKIIDIASGDDTTSLAFVVQIAIISFLIFMVFYYVYRIARPKFIQLAMTQYKNYIFNAILNKNIASLSNSNTGKLISVLTNDMRTVEDYYLDSILTIVDIGISFFGALFLMLWYNPILTTVAILLSILPILVSLPPAKKLAHAEKQVSDSNASYIESIKDILSGFTIIKSFRAEREIQNRFALTNERIEHIKYLRRYAEENVNLLSTLASVIMRLGVFITGAWMCISGNGVTPGIVLVFLQLVTFVISPIERMPSILANRKAAITIMNKLSDYLFSQDSLNGEHISSTSVNLFSIQNLSFGYENDNDILQDINITFQSGKKYAIVGTSGSGKSTLLSLLMRTYDNYRGNIFFNNIKLRDIHPDSLFQIISLVQQNVFVFNDTIINNVTLYKTFPEEEIMLALDRAGLSNLIAHRGKHFICGENGGALSGGEKQRISIARALLRKTSVLLMDEATAALDELTSNEIMNAILDLNDLTCISVTHRLDEKLLTKYDEIIVLHQGRIIEQGSFDNLLNNRGFFYSLFTINERL